MLLKYERAPRRPCFHRGLIDEPYGHTRTWFGADRLYSLLVAEGELFLYETEGNIVLRCSYTSLSCLALQIYSGISHTPVTFFCGLRKNLQKHQSILSAGILSHSVYSFINQIKITFSVQTDTESTKPVGCRRLSKGIILFLIHKLAKTNKNN